MFARALPCRSRSNSHTATGQYIRATGSAIRRFFMNVLRLRVYLRAVFSPS